MSAEERKREEEDRDREGKRERKIERGRRGREDARRRENHGMALMSARLFDQMKSFWLWKCSYVSVWFSNHCYQGLEPLGLPATQK